MEVFESSPDQPFRKKVASWARTPKDCQGNLCWLGDLFVSNRDRLQTRVTNSVVQAASNASNHQPAAVQKAPFKQVAIAADGRCGWRAILACQSPDLYQSIARTTCTAMHMLTP